MSREQATPQRHERAVKAVQKMGYDLEVVSAKFTRLANGDVHISVTLGNRGIAPFYHHGWAARLQLVGDQQVQQEFETHWSPRMIQPGAQKTYEQTIKVPGLISESQTLQLVFPNPMPGGKPIRLANRGVNPTTGALVIGNAELTPSSVSPLSNPSSR